MEIDNMKNIDDIEEILYDGARKDIEKVLKQYKISYEYSKECRSFKVNSMKLLEVSIGYKSHYTPNCVKYFGYKYTYKGILSMNEEEKNKAKDLLEAWQKEAKNIKDTSNQPKNGAILDNGDSGEYTKLTSKYQKLIEERIGRKIWNT